MRAQSNRLCRLGAMLGLALSIGNGHAASLSVTSNAPLADSFSLEVQLDSDFGAFLQQSLDQSGIRLQFLANFDALQAMADPGTRIVAAIANDGSVYGLQVHSAAAIFGDGMDNRTPRIYPSQLAPGTHAFDLLIDPATGMLSLMIDGMPYRSDGNIVPAGQRIIRLRFGYPLRSASGGSALFDNIVISEPGSMTAVLEDDFESGDLSAWDAAIP